jgi:hypothetical protein
MTPRVIGLLLLAVGGICGIGWGRPTTKVIVEPSVTVTVSPGGSAVTAPVTFSATTQGVTAPQYEFWIQPMAGIWQKIRETSSVATCVWVPPVTGSYTCMVRVREGTTAGLRCLAVSEPLTVTPNTPSGVAVNLTPTLPTMNLPVKIIAAATSASPLEYAFALRAGTGPYTLLQPYSAAAEYLWTPPAAGTYTVMALVRMPSSPASPEVSAVQTVVVNSGEQGGVSVAQFQGDRSAAVSYTFDDGMICQTEVIAPLFTRYGLTATFFINTEWVLEENDFSDPDRPADWRGWRRVMAAGHEIGNHTLSHQNLTTLNSTALAHEVNGSKDAPSTRHRQGRQCVLALTRYPLGRASIARQHEPWRGELV